MTKLFELELKKSDGWIGKGIKRWILCCCPFAVSFNIIGLMYLSILPACYLGNEPSAVIGGTLLFLLLDLSAAHAQSRHQVFV